MPHLGDVLADVEGRVVGDPVFEAGREVPRHAVHLLADLLDDLQGVGVGELVDRDRARGLAVEPAGRLVVLRVELDAGDVGEVNDRAVVVAAHDDLLELLDLREPPLGRDRVLEPLAGGAGRAPILPEAACLFSCWIAWTTSAGEIRWLAMRSGSSQTRMAYLRPKGFTSLTPGIRLSASTTLIWRSCRGRSRRTGRRAR